MSLSLLVSEMPPTYWQQIPQLVQLKEYPDLNVSSMFKESAKVGMHWARCGVGERVLTKIL